VQAYLSKIITIVLLLSLSLFSFADAPTIFPSNALYIGVNIGGGSTEWKYLVDTVDPNGNYTTPNHVSEGGPSWGAVFGYAINQNVALELQYMQFADASIQFPSFSPYTINPPYVTGMVSETNAYSLSAKFLAQLGDTPLRAFTAIGPGLVCRSDVLAHTKSVIAPYLSAGVNYNLNSHWMAEGGFQYYTGFGRSEIKPVKDFIPFAWDAYARLAYQFVV